MLQAVALIGKQPNKSQIIHILLEARTVVRQWKLSLWSSRRATTLSLSSAVSFSVRSDPRIFSTCFCERWQNFDEIPLHPYVFIRFSCISMEFHYIHMFSLDPCIFVYIHQVSSKFWSALPYL